MQACAAQLGAYTFYLRTFPETPFLEDIYTSLHILYYIMYTISLIFSTQNMD